MATNKNTTDSKPIKEKIYTLTCCVCNENCECKISDIGVNAGKYYYMCPRCGTLIIREDLK